MGQCVHIVASHDRLMIRFGGKYGEWLCGRETDFWRHFVTPVIPSGFGSDKTPGQAFNHAPRTSQHSSNIVPSSYDQDEEQSPPASNALRPREQRDKNQPPTSSKRLAESDIEENDGHNKRPKLQDSFPQGREPRTFSGLPQELHQCCMEQMNIDDIFFLGLTSQYFWELARGYIAKYYASFIGRLAGKAIVCTSDATDWSDHPPGLLTKAEVKELEEGPTEDDYDEYGEGPYDQLDGESVSRPMTLYQLATYRYGRLKPLDWLPSDLFHIVCDYGLHRLPTHGMRDVLYPCVNIAEFFPAPESWILCNLTSKEYVRSDAFGSPRDFLYSTDQPDVSDVILSRICWTTDPSINFCKRDCESMYRGKWAGHRFHIVPTETFKQNREKDKDNHEWKDVTREVKDEIFGTWARDHGTFEDTDDW